MRQGRLALGRRACSFAYPAFLVWMAARLGFMFARRPGLLARFIAMTLLVTLLLASMKGCGSMEFPHD